MQIIMSHANDEPIHPNELNPDVPSSLAHVIIRCLEKKPENRFADVRSLQTALIACETGDAWNAEQAARWWKRHGCPQKKKLDAEVLELSID